MSKKGNWSVKVKCVVEKELFCEDCTEEEAKDDPFSHASSEVETNQQDWEVLSVEANE